jgi:hypothetical protein
MSVDRRKIQRALEVQEQFQTYLVAAHPFTSADVIVTALTFEIGRLVGTVMPAEVDLDEVLANVTTVLREQIEAHRRGALPG